MDRRQLRHVLAEVAPWTTDPETGPAAVDAGECDRCGDQPRWVATCGAQPWPAICRDCLLELGTEAFCDGHRRDALDHVAAARALPDEWATITRLAWIASGEVRAGDDWVALVTDLARSRDDLARLAPPSRPGPGGQAAT